MLAAHPTLMPSFLEFLTRPARWLRRAAELGRSARIPSVSSGARGPARDRRAVPDADPGRRAAGMCCRCVPLPAARRRPRRRSVYVDRRSRRPRRANVGSEARPSPRSAERVEGRVDDRRGAALHELLRGAEPQAAPTGIMPAAVPVRMSTRESPTYATRAGDSPNRSAMASATLRVGLSSGASGRAPATTTKSRGSRQRGHDRLRRRVRLVRVDGERHSVRSQRAHELGHALVGARLDQRVSRRSPRACARSTAPRARRCAAPPAAPRSPGSGYRGL